MTDSKTNVNVELSFNLNYFVSTLRLFLDFCSKKIDILMQDQKSPRLIEYRRFKTTCDKLIDMYSGKDISNIPNNSKVIKKIYYTISEHIDYLKDKNKALFLMKNDMNQIVTIVSGLDMGLLCDHFDEMNMKILWNFMTELYIYATKMIIGTNPSAVKEKILEDLKQIEEKHEKIQDSFNPFLGLTELKTGEYSLDDLMAGKTKLNMMDFGMNGLINTEALEQQLSKISDADIEDTTKNISRLLGDDNDIKDVCSVLVKNIVESLKANGTSNLFQTLTSVSEKISPQLDLNKIKKTANAMNTLVGKSENCMKNLKDTEGNNIGEKLLSKMADPLQVIKNIYAAAGSQ